MDIKQEVYQVGCSQNEMVRIYKKIGIVDTATAVFIVPVLRDGALLFRILELKFPMMDEFVLN